jgi:hypothetical protein
VTESPIEDILAAGRDALEWSPGGRLDEMGVHDIVDVVGRAVLHAAAEKIRALDGCDPTGGAAGYDEGMDIAADWIDPTKEQP